MVSKLEKELRTALNVLTKWRTVFAGWQLGTRPKGDPECDAVRDHRELSLLLRAEMTAMTGLLMEKGVITQQDYQQALLGEAQQLNTDMAARFPGFTANEDGITVDVELAKKTTKDWKP
jgi:hypothetical protein